MTPTQKQQFREWLRQYVVEPHIVHIIAHVERYLQSPATVSQERVIKKYTTLRNDMQDLINTNEFAGSDLQEYQKQLRWLNDILEDLKSLQSPARGLRWVKATEMKIRNGKNYHAQWRDEDFVISSIGWFQESDGTFFWKEQGYVPIGEHERNKLYLLSDSHPTEQEQSAMWHDVIVNLSDNPDGTAYCKNNYTIIKK